MFTQTAMRRWWGEKGPWQCWVPPGVHVVYALLDADLQPIYVGQTNRLANRLRAHRAPGSRTNGYVSWTASEHPDRASALAAEARTIKVLRPPLNRAGL